MDRLKRPITITPDSDEHSAEPMEKCKKDTKSKQRQFCDKYLLYGFTCTSADPPQPQCFFCGEVLANTSMKPSHLHLTTKHPESSGKAEEFYKRKLMGFKTSQSVIKKAASVSSKALEAVSLLVAKSKKPHTIVEQLILAVNIVEPVVSKMRRAGHFALQLDERTDVSGEAQLLAFVRYKDESDINEHVLFCKALPGKTTGEEIFQMIDSFFKEHDIEWTYCTHICTDGAAAVSGGVKGLLGQVKKVNTEIKWLHCIIHCEALAIKRVSPERAAPSTNSFCLYGRALAASWENTTEHQHSLAVVFEDAEWVARLAELADVFLKLNLSLQGKESHILNMYDKVKGFTKKLELWLRKCDEMDVSCLGAYRCSPGPMFPLVKIVKAHLTKLSTDFNQNPFIMSESNKDLPAVLQEQLMDLFSDRGLKMGHTTKTLTEFWCDVEKEYADLGKGALSELLPFGSTYLCEVTFSALTHIKTKHRNRLAVESSQKQAQASH
uniref:DUF4371 domain-containing protein n=1 Tax=Neogobius melanostomus TaxID=47308 RepID=A0A8C6TXJ3_9GOBI